METDIYRIIENSLRSGESIVVKGSGNSMGKTICDCDSINLSPKENRIPKKGEIWLFQRPNGGFVIHRLIKKKNNRLFFVGDNQLTGEWTDECRLLGIVTEIYKNGSCDNAVDYAGIVSSFPFHKKRIAKYQLSRIYLRIKSYIDKYLLRKPTE